MGESMTRKKTKSNDSSAKIPRRPKAAAKSRSTTVKTKGKVKSFSVAKLAESAANAATSALGKMQRKAVRDAKVVTGKLNNLLKGLTGIVPGLGSALAQNNSERGESTVTPDAPSLADLGAITDEAAAAINQLVVSLLPRTGDMPNTIGLRPCMGKALATGVVAETREQIELLGFSPVGSYEITLVPDFRIHAYWSAEHRVFAVVYDTGANEPAVDIQRYFANGQTLLVTNTPGIDIPASTLTLERKIRLVGKVPAKLMRRMVAELSKPGTPPARDVGPEDFVALFEADYAANLFGMQVAELAAPASATGTVTCNAKTTKRTRGRSGSANKSR